MDPNLRLPSKTFMPTKSFPVCPEAMSVSFTMLLNMCITCCDHLPVDNISHNYAKENQIWPPPDEVLLLLLPGCAPLSAQFFQLLGCQLEGLQGRPGKKHALFRPDGLHQCKAGLQCNIIADHDRPNEMLLNSKLTARGIPSVF